MAAVSHPGATPLEAPATAACRARPGQGWAALHIYAQIDAWARSRVSEVVLSVVL
jgi:hypothetical protein